MSITQSVEAPLTSLIPQHCCVCFMEIFRFLKPYGMVFCVFYCLRWEV